MKMLMNLKQKCKRWPQLLLLVLLVSFAPAAPVLAAGDAYFSLSPSGGTYIVGNSFTVTVSETSSAGDNTNAAQVNLSYNSSLLQYTGMSYGVWSLCPSSSGGGGSVSVACAGSAQSGTQPVVAISFKALGSGTASVAMTSGSDIDNTSGTSVWGGSLPSASFNLNVAATPPPTHNTSPSSKSAPASSSSTPTSTSTTKPATTTTTKPTTTTQQQAPAAVTIIVVDASGQPVKGATVKLDGTNSMTTDSQGKANFAVESAGSHTVTITDPGKKPYQTKVSLIAGQSIPIEMQLTDAKSSGVLYTILGIVVVLLLVGVGLWFFKLKWLWPARAPSSVQITPIPAPVVAAPVAQAVTSTPRTDQQLASPLTEKRQDRSFYLRRRDSFDGIRGKH